MAFGLSRKSGIHRFDFARQFVAFIVVIYTYALKPVEEAVIRSHAVQLSSTLQQLDLREVFKFLPFLVEIDEAIFRAVFNGSVYHG
jgi:hypothetical protein